MYLMSMLLFIISMISILFLSNSIISLLISFEFMFLTIFCLMNSTIQNSMTEIFIFMIMMIMESIMGLSLMLNKILLNNSDLIKN